MDRTSTDGLCEIASHEGIVTSRYKDSVGVWTIGIGHTKAAGGVDPAKVTRELSIPEVMQIFREDLPKYEARVRKAFKRPLNQHQFDAAVSFDFNTGGIHRASWVDRFNAGDIAGARKAFMNWSKPKEIIPRRRKERDLFFNGTYSGGGVANVYPAVSGRVQWSKGRRVNVKSLLDENPPQKPAEPPKRPGGPVPPKTPETPPPSKSGGNSGKWAAGVIAALLGAGAVFWERVQSFFGGLF
jgi:lysozyme